MIALWCSLAHITQLAVVERSDVRGIEVRVLLLIDLVIELPPVLPSLRSPHACFVNMSDLTHGVDAHRMHAYISITFPQHHRCTYMHSPCLT